MQKEKQKYLFIIIDFKNNSNKKLFEIVVFTQLFPSFRPAVNEVISITLLYVERKLIHSEFQSERFMIDFSLWEVEFQKEIFG